MSEKAVTNFLDTLNNDDITKTTGIYKIMHNKEDIMDKYYIDTQTNNDDKNVVHKESCRRMPASSHCEELGLFSNPDDAIVSAKRRNYDAAVGCVVCCEQVYYVEKEENDSSNLVHTKDCSERPSDYQCENLGRQRNPAAAVTAAKKKGYEKAKECDTCCR